MAVAGIAANTPRIVLAELPPDDQDRILEYLVDNKVDFKAGAGNEEFYATIKFQKGAAGFGGSGEKRFPMRRTSLMMIEEQASKAEGGGIPFRNWDALSDMGNKSAGSRGGKSKATQNKSTMGFEAELELLHAEAESGPSFGIYKGLQQKYPRICKLLVPQDHRPKVMPTPLLWKFIHEVYEDRYRADSVMLHREKSHNEKSFFLSTDSDKSKKLVEGHATSFPRYVYDVTKKRKGVRALVQPTLWSVIYTVDAFRDQDTCASVFASFLDETYDHLTLLLYLHARHLAQRLLFDSLKFDPETQHRKRNATQRVYGAKLDKEYCQHLVKAVLVAKEDLRDKVLDSISDAIANKPLSPPQSPRSLAGASVTSADNTPSMAVDDLLALLAYCFHESRPKPRTGESDYGDDDVSSHATPPEIEASNDNQEEYSIENEELERTATELSKRIVKQLQGVNTECTPEQVQPWARSIAKRRMSVGYQMREEAAEQNKREEPTYTTSVREIKTCLKDMASVVDSDDAFSAMPPRSLSAFLQGTESLRPPTPADFEHDLEGTVHIILVVAVSEIVDQTLKSKGFDAETSPALFMRLVDEFQGLADQLLEVVVNENYKKWLQILQLPPGGSEDTHGRFKELYMELQRVLTTDISAQSVAHICRQILTMDELRALLVTRTKTLAKSSSSGTLVSIAGSGSGSGGRPGSVQDVIEEEHENVEGADAAEGEAVVEEEGEAAEEEEGAQEEGEAE